MSLPEIQAPIGWQSVLIAAVALSAHLWALSLWTGNTRSHRVPLRDNRRPIGPYL